MYNTFPLYMSQFLSLYPRMLCTTAAQLLGSGPAVAELHATVCVVINHAGTQGLSGLSATLTAYGPEGTSGVVWGRLRGDHGPFVTPKTATRRIASISHRKLPLLSLPPGSRQTQLGQKVYIFIT